MPAHREQIEQLVAAAPNFRNRWEGFLKDCEGEEVPPWFVGMSELAHVVESYAKGVTAEFPNLFGRTDCVLNPVMRVVRAYLCRFVPSISASCDSGYNRLHGTFLAMGVAGRFCLSVVHTITVLRSP
jgi:hypothetical protein